MSPGTKTCAECGDTRPDTPLHFPTFRKKAELCLACVTGHRRARRERKQAAREKRMAKMEEQAVDALIKTASRGGGNVPHSAELLEQVMTFFGGVNGFSGLLLKHFFDTKPGSPQRTKILEMITRLVTTNADQGGSKKPLNLWSEEEIQAELDVRLQQAVEQMIPQQAMIGLPSLEVETVGEAAEATADAE